MSSKKIEINVSYDVSKVYYRDANVCYAKAVAPGRQDLYFCFYADKFDQNDAEKPVTAKKPGQYPTIEGPFKIAFIPTMEEPEEHILPLLAFGCTSGWTILAYRFVPMLPLWLHMAKTVAFRRTEALKLTAQIARALAFLHRADRLSTEIHSANVFVDLNEGKTAYLGYNMGMGKKLYSRLIEKNVHLQRFAVETPEQIWGEGADIRSDVFQLGALATTMLTKKYLKATSALKSTWPPPIYPPKEFTDGLPKGMDDLAKKTLSQNPGDRLKSAAEVVDLIEGDSSRIPIICEMSEAMANRHKAINIKIASRRKKSFRHKKEETTGPTLPRNETKLLLTKFSVILILLLTGALFVAHSGNDGTLVEGKSTVALKENSNKLQVSISYEKQCTAVKQTEAEAPIRKVARTTNTMLSSPTNEETIGFRLRFLKRIYVSLAPHEREKAIGKENLRAIIRYKRKGSDEAYRRMDETLAKLRDYGVTK